STALEDVKMSDSFNSSDPNHESTMPRPMGICSVISDSPHDGDINMESSDPSIDFAMSDSTDTDSMVQGSQSLNSWDSDSDPRFPSPPGSIRFTSRKRARYTCFSDNSSSSEPKYDCLKFKHIK